MVYGTVYAIPTAIGPVDIATVGSILLHLRDPFLALQNACQLTREKIIIADMLPRRLFWLWGLGRCFGSCVSPLFGRRASFLPDFRTGAPDNAWWYLSPQVIRDMIAVLGFEKSRRGVSQPAVQRLTAVVLHGDRGPHQAGTNFVTRTAA